MLHEAGYYAPGSSIFNFAPTNRPSWRSVHQPDTQQMLDEIIRIATAHHMSPTTATLSKQCTKQLAFMYVLESNAMEMVGTDDEQATFDIIEGVACDYVDSRKQKETINTFLALKQLYDTQEELRQLEGASSKDQIMLTLDTLLTTHHTLMSGLHVDAGKVRTGMAATKTDVGWHFNMQPQHVPSAVQCLIDHHNFAIANKLCADLISDAPLLFNLAAQLLLRFLTIRPFGDGNGRMGRLLVNHILQPLLPFPVRMTPPYVSRSQFLRAITSARLDDGQLVAPCDLAAMIIEGTWYSVKDAIHMQNQLASKSRGQMFVGSEGMNMQRYSLLREIGLTEAEKAVEIERLRTAAQQMLGSKALVSTVELLNGTNCTLTQEV